MDDEARKQIEDNTEEMFDSVCTSLPSPERG